MFGYAESYTLLLVKKIQLVAAFAYISDICEPGFCELDYCGFIDVSIMCASYLVTSEC